MRGRPRRRSGLSAAAVAVPDPRDNGYVKASQPGQTSGPPTASAAIQRASRLLLARQDSAGWWTGRPEGDVCLDVEALLLREFLGIRTAEQTNAAAQQIRSSQRTDGSWAGRLEAGYAVAPGTCAQADDRADLSASVLAYLALRLAGDSPDAYHMAVAAGWIRDAGGIGRASLLARIWLATFGLAEWEGIHVPVPEAVYLPARRCAGPGGWAACSRNVMVTLAVIGAVRPVRKLEFDLNALLGPAGLQAPNVAAWPRASRRRGLRVPPASAARSAALRKCGQWLVNWQQRDGRDRFSPAWPYSLLALHLLGYPLRHPVLAGGLAWLDSVTARPRSAAGHGRTAEVRQPPVRDTALAIRALCDAGLPGDHPALVTAGNWLLARRIQGPADPRDAEPSGWSFGIDGYPSVGDTAGVLLALNRVRLPTVAVRPAVQDGIAWLTGMQARDGSWGRGASVTAVVVHALAVCGRPASQAIRSGVVWLLRAQRADGCWPGGPGETDLHATAVVLPALLSAGVRPDKPVISDAIGWLTKQQNLDAGWASGAGKTSRKDGHGRSDPAGTALAAAALLAVGGADVAESVQLGTGWLVQAQHADGGWGDRPRGRGSRPGSVVGGLLLPLSTLGKYVAADRAGKLAAGSEPPIATAELPAVCDRR